MATAEILLTARDLTGGAFKSVGSSIDGLESAAGRTGSAFGSMTNRIAEGASAFIGMQAASVAMGAVTKTVEGLKNAIADGFDRQADFLSSTNTAMKTLGLSYSDASTYVQKFNESVGIMGRDLPTSAESISAVARTLQDEFAMALKPKGLSADAIGDALRQSSAKIALLGEMSNTNINDTRAGISALIAGSLGERGLNQYKLFAENTLFKNNLVDNLQKLNTTGKKAFSFGDITLAQRVDVLRKSLDTAMTDEDIKRLQDLPKASISSFMDRLFDPETGMLSLSRDLDPQIPGYQSVITTFGETIKLLLGDDGIFWEVARIFGLSGDVMKDLRDWVQGINGILENLLGDLKNLSAGDFEGAGAMFGRFAGDLLKYLLDGAIDLIIELLPRIITFWRGYAQSLTPKIIQAVLGSALSLVSSVPGMIMSGIVSAIVNPIMWVFNVVRNAIGGAINAIVGAVRSLIDAVVTPIARLVGAVGGSVGSIATGTGNVAKSAAGSVGGFFSGMVSGIGGFFSSMLPKYSGYIPTAANGWIGSIAQEQRNSPKNSKLLLANTSEFVFTPEQMRRFTNGVQQSAARTTNITIAQGGITLMLPSGTPQEIAIAAIAIIEQNLKQEIDTRLA